MSEWMDNFKVHVVARSDEALERAVELAMLDYKAAAWKGDGDTLILFWSATLDKDVQALPCPLSASGSMPLIRAWLQAHPPPRDQYPDIDGSASAGFELDTGPKDRWSSAFMRIKQIWAQHHK